MQDASSITSNVLVQHGALAIFGGLVHALYNHRMGKTKGVWDVIALVIMASFSGVLFFLLALHLFPEYHYLTAASAGAGGFLGVEGLSVIAVRIRNFLIK